MFDRVTQGGISPGRYGAANMMGLTLPPGPQEDAAEHAAPSADGADDDLVGGHPGVALVGFIGLLGLLWLVRKNSSYLQQNTFGINAFTVLTTTVIAVIGIVFLKFAFTKFPVPGVTPFLHAV